MNPDMPKEGIDRKKYLEIKFNGRKNAKNIYGSIYEKGLKHGIHFQFDTFSTMLGFCLRV